MQSSGTIEELVAYVLGSLGPDASRDVGARVAESETLRQTVDEIRDVVAALERARPAEADHGLVERAVALFRAGRRRQTASMVTTILARLVFDSRQSALAGLRGGAGDSYRLSYSSGIGEVDLEVLAPGPACGEWRVVGQADRTGHDDVRASLVRAGPEGGVLATAGVDDRGVFRLCAAAGEYDLLLNLDGTLLVMPGLRLGR